MKANAGLKTGGCCLFHYTSWAWQGGLSPAEGRTNLKIYQKQVLVGVCLNPALTQASGKSLLFHQGEGSSLGVPAKGMKIIEPQREEK